MRIEIENISKNNMKNDKMTKALKRIKHKVFFDNCDIRLMNSNEFEWVEQVHSKRFEMSDTAIKTITSSQPEISVTIQNIIG